MKRYIMNGLVLLMNQNIKNNNMEELTNYKQLYEQKINEFRNSLMCKLYNKLF